MKENEFIATTMFGLEEILAGELRELGAENIRVLNRAVSFDGSQAILYKVNLGARTAMRVLKNLRSFRVTDEESLYNAIYNMKWEEHFSIKDTFMINSSVSSTRFRHSLFVSQKVKDAIADRFRKITNLRPSVSTSDPDITINIHISNDRADVSLDSSGEPLFKRGYRAAQYIAPLNEVLAAGMIILSGWDGSKPFIDPMCGSGTLAIEATLIAKKIPPGIFREKFGFMNWKDYDSTLFKRILESMLDPSDLKTEIFASDISQEAIELTNKNIKKALLDEFIHVKKQDFKDFIPSGEGGLVMMNPPYGERLKEEEINLFYQEIGDTLKKNFSGHEAWVLSGNPEALKYFGLRPEKKIELINGSIKCKFQKFSIYQGSKKHKMKDS